MVAEALQLERFDPQTDRILSSAPWRRHEGAAMQNDIGSRFIRDNFESQDRLAVVSIDSGSAAVTQRIASARQIASPEFQVWLKSENRSGRDVFVSMNALNEQARGRTGCDVAAIPALVSRLRRGRNPGCRATADARRHAEPNYLVNTSPDHWQVSWKVQGFAKEQAEEMMRGMVREFGADPAATDVSRVLRVPGFANHKRSGHMVRMEQLSAATYSPDHFPRFEQEDRRNEKGGVRSDHGRHVSRGHLSQSELDWAYAKRALARGESPDKVAASIAEYRRGDKADPEYYARLTVRKAVEDLAGARSPQESAGPDR